MKVCLGLSEILVRNNFRILGYGSGPNDSVATKWTQISKLFNDKYRHTMTYATPLSHAKVQEESHRDRVAAGAM